MPTRTRTRTGPGEAVPIRDGRSSTPTDQPAAREVSGAFTPEAIAVNVLDIHPQTTLSASGHHTLHPPFQIGYRSEDDTGNTPPPHPQKPTDAVPTARNPPESCPTATAEPGPATPPRGTTPTRPDTSRRSPPPNPSTITALNNNHGTKEH